MSYASTTAASNATLPTHRGLRPFEHGESNWSRLVSTVIFVPMLLLALPDARSAGYTDEFVWSVVVTFGLSSAGTFLPWRHLPRWLEAVPPLVSTVSMALIVEAIGGIESGFAVLLPLTILWMAIYASGLEVGIGLALLAVMLLTPMAHWIVPSFPADRPLEAGFTWVVVIAFISTFVHRLVRSHQREQDAARQAHAELELSHHAMVHDLKGPLAVTASMAQTGATLVDVDGEGAVAYFEFIENAMRQMELLVDDVMLLRGGLGPHDLGPLDPAAVVLQAASQVRGVRVTSDELPATIHGNAFATVRAMRNLLENAARHASADPERPAHVHVTGRVSDAGVEIAFEDDGPGVPTELLERVFDRFQRGASTVGGSAPGAGLGLAIVRACAEVQGATVHAEHGASGGLRVCLRFPPGPAGERTQPQSRPVHIR